MTKGAYFVIGKYVLKIQNIIIHQQMFSKAKCLTSINRWKN